MSRARSWGTPDVSAPRGARDGGPRRPQHLAAQELERLRVQAAPEGRARRGGGRGESASRERRRRATREVRAGGAPTRTRRAHPPAPPAPVPSPPSPPDTPPPPSTPSSRPRRPRRRDDRLAALRARARGEPPPASTDPARARAKSVNFFEAEEKALLKTKAEFDQRAGARLGGEKPGEVPWYARRRRSPSPDGVGAAAEGLTLGESGLTSHGVDGRAAKRRKKEKKKRRPKTGGARGGDDDDDKAPRRSSGRAEPSSSDKIAKLREERLAREANERRRQRERTGVR